MFEELVKEITKELEVQESRGRARSGDAQNNFEYAVRYILGELWKASLSYPQGECLINLRSGYYSELHRYRDNNLTYRQIKAHVLLHEKFFKNMSWYRYINDEVLKKMDAGLKHKKKLRRAKYLETGI